MAVDPGLVLSCGQAAIHIQTAVSLQTSLLQASLLQVQPFDHLDGS
jgi:hypothetical protein